MDIISKKLLLVPNTVTLTVITNPSGAICNLTYNGVSYQTKTLQVKKGSTVSYSVSYSNTMTKTGSVTMDRDKTLTFTRTSTSTPSTSDVSWSQPTLSSNGTLGSGTMAVQANGNASGYPAWKAFDGVSSGTDAWVSNTANTGYIIIYTSTAIKITSMTITAYNNSSTYRTPKTGSLLAGSSSSSISATLGSFSNPNANNTITITPSSSTNTHYYKYHKIDITSNYNASYGPGIYNVNITAKYQNTTYITTYYFTVTTT